MKWFCCLFVGLFVCIFSFAQQFEGEMCFVKTTYSDTLYYTYTIKGNNVRIDEYDKYNRLTYAYIVDIDKQVVLLINPQKQLYTQVEKSKEQKATCEVTHTGNYKYINGNKCVQWRIRNEESNWEMTYWIADGEYDFYKSMAKVASPIDDSFAYCSVLPEEAIQHAMPMMIECKTLLRAPKSTLRVTKITPHPIESSVFDISQYQKFENLR